MGGALEVERVEVSYGTTRVLKGISLAIAPGEFVALLGSSGCGKTTLLRAISGFVPVTAGAVRADGRDITHASPDKRDMAMVFQSYALWPHMSAAQNIGYGLRVRGWERARIAARIDEMLRLGLATLSEDGQTVRLEPGRYVPEKDEAQLFDFLGANVGDHLAAATANVAGRGQRHFEQAIFADELSESTAQAVRQLAARQWSRVLAEVVPELERLVAEDQAAGRSAGHRARIGMFTFHEAEKDDGNPSEPQP